MPLKKIPTGTPPGGVKSVAAALSTDTNKDLQILITTAVNNAIQPLISKIDSFEEKITSFQQQILDLKKSSQEFKQEIKETQQKLARNETKITTSAKKLDCYERELITMQLEKSKTVLRLQNFPESPGDLKDQMSTFLAPLMKKPKEAIISQIEDTYRVSSAFIKKHKLPREVHLRLTNKDLRDQILKKSNESQFAIGDVKLKILKDIPYLARQRRKKYKSLTSLLIQNKIRYIWCNIDGIKFDFKNKTFKITTELKLRDFMKQYGAELGSRATPSSEGEHTEGESSEEEEKSEQQQEDLSLQGAVAVGDKKKSRKYSLRERDK